jgi:peptidoglycan/LPS O-acetylase OafA/YrhL
MEAVPTSSQKMPHVLELQSIRGLAALLVLVGHCISYYDAPSWWTNVKLLVNTQAAVEIFFVLSGFVLAASLVRKPITQGSVFVYYAKRMFRIYPALIFASCIAFLYLAAVHFTYPDPYISQWMSERFRADRFAPLYIIASFAGMLAYLIPPVWTIFVEIVASIFIPWFALLMVKGQAMFVAVGLALLGLSLGLGGALYYHLDVFLVDFVLGASLLLIDPAPLKRHISGTWLSVMLPVIAATLLLGTRVWLDVERYDPWMQLYESILAAFIIFIYGRCGVVSPFLRSRALVWLGDISFSVYLLHFTVMCVIARAFVIFSPNFVTQVGAVAASGVLTLLTLAITLPLAAWAYRNIEIPGIGLGTFAVQRFGRSHPQQSRAASGKHVIEASISPD